jgi:hypothetical protein
MQNPLSGVPFNVKLHLDKGSNVLEVFRNADNFVGRQDVKPVQVTEEASFLCARQILSVAMKARGRQ